MSSIQINIYILVAVLILAVIGNHAFPPIVDIQGRINEDFHAIPSTIGEWTGYDLKFDQATYDALPSCSLLLRIYTNPSDEEVDLAIVYGKDLGDFHQPEVCLQGQGWNIKTRRHCLIRIARGKTLSAVRLFMSNNYEDRVTVYWFAAPSITSTELGRHKIGLYLDRLAGHREIQPTALIRASSGVSGSEEEAYKRVEEIVSLLVPYFDKILAGHGHGSAGE